MVICRGCNLIVTLTFLNLGLSPIANDLIAADNLKEKNDQYPLHAMTCENCGLVQLSDSLSREKLFSSEYVYYSSFSKSWLEHSKLYAKKMIKLLSLDQNDLVIEVGSNDGYLLQYFSDNNIPVLGIEPSLGVAESAISKGIPTMVEFFGDQLALNLREIKKPKLLIANNVLAHVPDILNFVRGFSTLIADDGIITFEFPHLLNLIRFNQFDTIYHEHYSYLSLTSLLPIFEQCGLKVVNIEKIATHGGSLRLFLTKTNSELSQNDSVRNLIHEELVYDPRKEEVFSAFQKRVLDIKESLILEMSNCKNNNLRIAAYGAAAKGVTLLNFCKLDSNVIDFVVDLNPNKQKKFIPSLKIPVVDPIYMVDNPPDVLLVLPWNISNEIKLQNTNYVENGMKLVRAIPKVEYF
jgi:hypothetical protein